MKSPIVGIDLGTTFSLVAVLRDGVPTILPNALGEGLTASAVSVTDDGSVLVGAPARARATTHPGSTALAFKRDMGTERRIELGGKSFSAPELSALVLGALKRDAEAALGCPVEEAVITVPAYFGDQQRQATRDAGAIAGLTVERIINEPTAAALAHGLHAKDRELRAVVLDLGGGTFDVTVLEIIEGVVEIQASAGDARLGGEDFDEALAERFARLAEAKGIDVRREARAWARVREAAEGAKRRLSSVEATSIALPDLPLGGGRTASLELSVTRDEAEEAWAALLERVRVPIQRALRDASVKPGAIDEVLLVGGSTRMPCVARLAAQVFGKLPLRALPPDEAVALGAAVQAALKDGDAAVEDLVVTDVAPFTMGIESSTQFGSRLAAGMFSPILERGTVIPASRVERFSTMGDGQTQVSLRVYQGEHSLCRDNHLLGEYVIKELPRRAAGEETIDVRFTYDLNGILEVETTVVSTGKKHVLVIEKSPGRLSKADVEAARRAMAGLKLHARDALPNTTALARADALYVELTGPAREQLGMALQHFRGALETQDPRIIEAVRGRLNELVTALKRHG